METRHGIHGRRRRRPYISGINAMEENIPQSA
jgi:hypothetical protein